MTNISDIRVLKEKDKNHHYHPMTNPVKFAETGSDLIVKAEGIYIYTDDGRKIIDAGSGLGNVILGYANEHLCNVAFRTMKQLSFGHTLFGRSNPWAAALSEKLAAITPDSYRHFFFASTGSEAIESSIKMALHYWHLREKPKKRLIIGRHHSYHGNTIVAASLTGLEAFHTQFGLPLPGMVLHAESPYWYRYGDGRSKEEFGLEVAASLENKIREVGAENIAAFVSDPIQTGGGTIIPPASYWPEVRRLCDQYDILLIADEVLSGFGKTGYMFGFENFNFEPDMFCMAKGLSSGYFPISSVAIGNKVSDVLQESDEIFSHVFTNCGHPVGAAVALETIAIIEEQGLVAKVRDDIGPYFNERLRELLDFPCVGEIRTAGVFGAIEIDMSKINMGSAEDNEVFTEKYIDIAWQKGLALRGQGLTLPMIITRAQIDEIINILKCAFTEALQ